MPLLAFPSIARRWNEQPSSQFSTDHSETVTKLIWIVQGLAVLKWEENALLCLWLWPLAAKQTWPGNNKKIQRRLPPTHINYCSHRNWCRSITYKINSVYMPRFCACHWQDLVVGKTMESISIKKFSCKLDCVVRVHLEYGHIAWMKCNKNC